MMGDALSHRRGRVADGRDVLADPIAGGDPAITFDALFAQDDLACAVWNMAPA
ncbi:hypothetical protein AB5I41_11175 [Sphingomonas sp. MMS24-JH45]